MNKHISGKLCFIRNFSHQFHTHPPDRWYELKSNTDLANDNQTNYQQLRNRLAPPPIECLMLIPALSAFSLLIPLNCLKFLIKRETMWNPTIKSQWQARFLFWELPQKEAILKSRKYNKTEFFNIGLVIVSSVTHANWSKVTGVCVYMSIGTYIHDGQRVRT